MLREEDGRVLLRHLLTIQAVSYDDSETEDLVGGRPDEEEASALPGWMKACTHTCTHARMHAHMHARMDAWLGG